MKKATALGVIMLYALFAISDAGAADTGPVIGSAYENGTGPYNPTGPGSGFGRLRVVAGF